jgi:16S rRNA (uracil1498-N3)-methyltransferase
MSDGFFWVYLPADVTVGSMIDLTGAEAHHLAQVRRIGPGEIVTLTDGRGRGVRGPVRTIQRQAVTVEVAELLRAEPSRPCLSVVQALPKSDRAELAVDLMTELGVDRIVPWQAARSIGRWRGERGEKARARWAAVARAAAQQSRRLTVPEVAPLATTRQVAELLGQTGLAVVMHETAITPVALLRPQADVPVTVVIGPEGGIAPDELALFEAAGARPFSMGRTVLRTSTAGAVAVAQLRLLAELAR